MSISEAIKENLYGNLKNPKNWDYSDSVRLADFLKIANDDIGQTIRHKKEYESGKRPFFREDNPITAKLLESPDLLRTLGFIGQGYLANRWAGQNKETRQREMLIANLIEAMAMQYSGEPWKLNLYANEF